MYDNTGGDEGEAVAIAGPVGIDLTGYQVLAYNGADGQVYRTVPLGGTLVAPASNPGGHVRHQ